MAENKRLRSGSESVTIQDSNTTNLKRQKPSPTLISKKRIRSPTGSNQGPPTKKIRRSISRSTTPRSRSRSRSRSTTPRSRSRSRSKPTPSSRSRSRSRSSSRSITKKIRKSSNGSNQGLSNKTSEPVVKVNNATSPQVVPESQQVNRKTNNSFVPPNSDTPSNSDPSENQTKNIKIQRLYHYDNETLVFNENFASNPPIEDNSNPFGFAHTLNRIHGFIDCIHDQFDCNRKNIFFSNNKKNEDELKTLIWKYFIGEGESFTTKGKSYLYNTSIHTLGGALEIDEYAPDTLINLQRIQTNTTNNSETKMKFKCIDWNTEEELSPLTVYKFKNYTTNNGSENNGQRLKSKYAEGERDANTNYILDCGSRSFHEGVVGKNNDNNGISFFSGILDSSTTNDPVPDITDEKLKKKNTI